MAMNRRTCSVRILSMVLMVLFAIGCSGNRSNRFNAGESGSQVLVTRDEDGLLYQGPTLEAENEREEGPEDFSYSLRASGKESTSLRTHLSVQVTYQGHWQGYFEAVDGRGRVFEAARTDQKVHCELFCEYEDFLEIPLDRPSLDQYVRLGEAFIFRLRGPQGVMSGSFRIPSSYIRDFTNTLKDEST